MKPPRKVEVPLERFNRLINHGPCVLVTTTDGERVNVAPVAWVMPCGRKPPAVALTIGAASYTYELLRRNGELVINVPCDVFLDAVVRCGKCSGRDVDKFERFGLTPAKARTVSAPWVAEAMGHLECVLVDGYEAVADRFSVFIAEVKSAWVEEGTFDDGRWLVEAGAAPTLHHLGGSHFVTPGRLLEWTPGEDS